MTALSPHAKPIALLAGFICMLEAVAWLAMSILGLIGHGECKLWEEPSKDSYSFLIYVQQIYFQDRKCTEGGINVRPDSPWLDKIMTPSAIFTWMIIMVAVNSVWIIASLAFIGGWDDRRMKLTVPISATWCFVTAVVCVVDVIACAMFGADYGFILEDTVEPHFLAPSAVLMTLSARGFVLWVFNFSMLIYFTSKMPKLQSHVAEMREAEKNMTPLDLYGPPAPGYDAFNEGFVAELHNSQSRSQSRRGSATASLTRGYQITPGQHIPRPDYSPPIDARQTNGSKNNNQPALRSALKNKF